MEQKTQTAVASTAYGKKLPEDIKYEYTYEVYQSIEEVKQANDMLTDAEVIKVRNTERQSNARQKALQAALDAAGIVKPTIDNDEQLRLRDMFKVLMSSKRYTEEEARDLAATTLGLTWE